MDQNFFTKKSLCRTCIEGVVARGVVAGVSLLGMVLLSKRVFPGPVERVAGALAKECAATRS